MATSIARGTFRLIANYSCSTVNHGKHYAMGRGHQGRWRYLFMSSASSSVSQVPTEMSSSSSDHETQQEDTLPDPYEEEKEPCLLCKAKIPISFKNPELLSQFVSPNTGRIYDRQITGLCENQQRRVAGAIKRARVFGYMPVMYRETYFLKNPDLFDVKYTGNVNIGDHILYPGANSADEAPLVLVKKTDKPKGKRTEKVKVTKSEKRKSKNR